MSIIVKKNSKNQIVEVFLRELNEVGCVATQSHPCDECSLLCKFNFTPPSGVEEPDLYLVSDHPDAETSAAQLVMAPDTFKVIADVMELTGSMDIRMMNVVSCPPINEKGMFRAPHAREVRQCKQYLYADMKKHRPRGILAMGGLATSVMGNWDGDSFNLTDVRGNLWVWEGIPVVPTWHPKYVLMDKKLYVQRFEQFVSDLATLMTAMNDDLLKDALNYPGVLYDDD